MVLLAIGGTAGAIGGRWARLPMWPLTGSIVGAAAVHLLLQSSGALPGWWSVAAQVLVGAAVGSGIQRGVFGEFRSVLIPGILAVVSIIGVGVAAGLAIASTGRVGHIAAALGMVPGGVAEMVAAATALDADSAVVAGMHVVRLVLVLTAMPLLVGVVRRVERRRGKDA